MKEKNWDTDIEGHTAVCGLDSVYGIEFGYDPSTLVRLVADVILAADPHYGKTAARGLAEAGLLRLGYVKVLGTAAAMKRFGPK